MTLEVGEHEALPADRVSVDVGTTPRFNGSTVLVVGDLSDGSTVLLTPLLGLLGLLSFPDARSDTGCGSQVFLVGIFNSVSFRFISKLLLVLLRDLSRSTRNDQCLYWPRHCVGGGGLGVFPEVQILFSNARDL